MNKNQFYDILLMFLIYLFSACFPWNLIFHNDVYLLISAQIILSAIVLAYLIYMIRYRGYVYPPRRNRWMNILLFIPVIVICFSNYLYLPFYQYQSINSFSLYTWLWIILTVFTVINEEILFRYILLHTLTFDKPIMRILVSSLIFALFHISHFLTTFNPYYLLSVVYTFALGMVLGLLYQYGKSLTMCIIFHFLFNLCNDVLFSTFFIINNQIGMVVVSSIVGVVVAIYLASLYLLRFKKEDF